jgi:trimethylamine--corrinoid protein Co-methyltransferase
MALLASGIAQISRYYDLPNSIVAGISSAKVPDAQYGWEKGYLTALVSQSGANMVPMAMGGIADNVGFSSEALVIDDSMLTGVLRCLKGIDVSDQSLGLESIRRAITGSGHFLGDEMTLSNMKTEFVYPEFADRLSIDAWLEAGSPDIRDKARAKVSRILSEHYPEHIGAENDHRIREKYEIQLPRSVMRP